MPSCIAPTTPLAQRVFVANSSWAAITHCLTSLIYLLVGLADANIVVDWIGSFTLAVNFILHFIIRVDCVHGYLEAKAAKCIFIVQRIAHSCIAMASHLIFQLCLHFL